MQTSQPARSLLATLALLGLGAAGPALANDRPAPGIHPRTWVPSTRAARSRSRSAYAGSDRRGLARVGQALAAAGVEAPAQDRRGGTANEVAARRALAQVSRTLGIELQALRPLLSEPQAFKARIIDTLVAKRAGRLSQRLGAAGGPKVSLARAQAALRMHSRAEAKELGPLAELVAKATVARHLNRDRSSVNRDTSSVEFLDDEEPPRRDNERAHRTIVAGRLMAAWGEAAQRAFVRAFLESHGPRPSGSDVAP